MPSRSSSPNLDQHFSPQTLAFRPSSTMANYIASWVTLLTDHKQAIVSAAAKASAAAEYLKAASQREEAA